MKPSTIILRKKKRTKRIEVKIKTQMTNLPENAKSYMELGHQLNTSEERSVMWVNQKIAH
jgi:hypothetical protein